MPRRTIDHVSTQTKVINIATKTPIASPDIPVVCERIRYYRTLRGIEQGYIARTLGISPNSVSNWETGRTRPDINFLPRLCSMLGITFYQLYNIEDPSEQYDKREKKLIDRYRSLTPAYKTAIDHMLDDLLEAREYEKAETRKIRRLTEFEHHLAAGVSFADEYEDQGKPIYVYSDLTDNRADCVFTVNGDSMEPLYANGDRVLVERLYRADDLSVGEIGAFADGNDLWIKEYRSDGLYSRNPSYPPMLFGEDSQLALIGRVLGKLPEDAEASESDAAQYRKIHADD